MDGRRGCHINPKLPVQPGVSVRTCRSLGLYISHEKAEVTTFSAYKVSEWSSFHENPSTGYFLSVLLPKRRRRSLAGRSQSVAMENSGGRGGAADNHHGHSSGRWRHSQVRNRPKSLEC